MGYVPPIPTRSKAKLLKPLFIGLGVASAGILGGMLLMTNLITLGGIPYPILAQLWQDSAARSAYLAANRQVLQERINALGVEAALKAYYQPQIRDQAKLDQHVHQILYDRLGYVGETYQIGSGGRVVPKVAKQPIAESF